MANHYHMQKAANRKVSEENIAGFQSLSLEEQVKELDRRLGKGVGAVKQRARLAAKIAEQKAVVEVKEEKAAKKAKKS